MHHCLDARQARSMRHRVASSPLASAHPRSRAASDGTPHAPLVVRTQLATAGHALPRQGRAGQGGAACRLRRLRPGGRLMPPPCRHSRGASAPHGPCSPVVHGAAVADSCAAAPGSPGRRRPSPAPPMASPRLLPAVRRRTAQIWWQIPGPSCAWPARSSDTPPLVSVEGSACALPARSGQQAWANASIAVLEGDTQGGFVDRPAGDPRVGNARVYWRAAA